MDSAYLLLRGLTRQKKIIAVVSLFLAVIVTVIVLTNTLALSDPDGFEAGEDIAATVSSETMVHAYGLYIDGNFIAASESQQVISHSLDKLMKAKIDSLSLPEVSSSEFVNQISIVSSSFALSAVVEERRMMECLGIVDDYNYTFELKNLDGHSIESEISIRVTTIETEEAETDYDTVYIDNTAVSEGNNTVLSTGSCGTEINTYENVYIDGVLVESEQIASSIIEEPTSEVVERGINNGSKTTMSSIQVLSWPYEGMITSAFGWRPSLGDFHNAIDITALPGVSCYGDDALAAADGVVITSERKGSYGLYVVIDHGGGLVTLYSHLSALGVEVGDRVSAGDVIGQIGNTGYVTGPHLHFEVRVDGVSIDPMLFLEEK